MMGLEAPTGEAASSPLVRARFLLALGGMPRLAEDGCSRSGELEEGWSGHVSLRLRKFEVKIQCETYLMFIDFRDYVSEWSQGGGC
jgi:hypothetical protein